MDEQNKYPDDREGVNQGFIEEMRKKFQEEEAEGIEFSFGCYVTDYQLGITFNINDGKLEIVDNQLFEKIEECDIYVAAPLEILQQIGADELAISDLQAQEADELSFGGDMGLIYELYNIFQLPV